MRVTPATVVKSPLLIAWDVYRPTPGQAKMTSISRTPLNRAAIWTPPIDNTGPIELRKAWRRTTTRSARPLERAVRT
jgi:hypothetical protein